MKNRIHLLTFILLLATSICVAQKESVLRIILPKGNVTVDNSPVKSGQHLTSSSKKLLIDKGSYAYVLTPKGYVMRLGTGNWTIAEIEDFIVKSDRYSKPPAVHRQVEPLEFIGFEFPPSREVMKDHIVLRWRQNPHSAVKVGPPFQFTMLNGFDEVLYKTSVDWYDVHLNSVRTLAKQNQAIFCKLNERDSETVTIKFISKSDSIRIAGDLSGIPVTKFKTIYDLIIYDCNDLPLDVITTLDAIYKKGDRVFDKNLENYLAILGRRLSTE